MLLKNATLLAIDDDPDVLLALKMLLKPEVKEIITEKDPERLPALLAKTHFDLVLLDMNFKSALHTGNEGLFWLRKIKEKYKNTLVIMITAYGDIDVAVQSLKDGASDFVLKPWRNEKLLETLRNLSAPQPPKGEPRRKQGETGLGWGAFLGKSEMMQEIFYKIEKIAPTDANVLILGENGTGKELVAKALHHLSLRAEKDFVSVDLGSLTESLFESELFGYKKGAFTDAREDRTGRIEIADKGTLFLDEIGNISLPQQAKLLSVLQNRQVTRLGSNQPVPVDIRVVSATNAPVYQLAAENLFRKDLIYRLNTIEIHLPPLRERGEDILLLANHFAQTYAQKYRKPELGISEEALEKLKNYTFPGNVRELQHLMERAVIMAEGNSLQARDLTFSNIESSSKSTISEEVPFHLAELEKVTIQKAIDRHNGNITKAARELGLTRTALYRRLGKYDM
jgi:two-component system, NtrC family, response regulator HydG